MIFLVLSVIGLVLGEVALAEPAAITEAKNEAQALRDRIDELAAQLDAAVEDYNYAKAKLAETKAAAEKNQLNLTKAETDLELANAALMERMVEIYKQGNLGVLDALLGAASFSEVVNYLDQMERLSEQDAEIVSQVSGYQDQVEARKAELAQQMEDEKILTAEAEAAKGRVQEQLVANEKALAGKQAQIDQLEKEEAERQARIAAEARRKAEEARKKAEAKAAAEAAAQAQAAAAAKAKPKATTVQPSKNVSVAVPESASSSKVVSIAMQYLGCPYVWAGESPSGFDCSGFVMYVYRKVGVSLPHSSRMQYTCGQPVSRGNLKPGDLIFFHNPISHVAIYIGDGQMIHAAGTGKNVRIDTVWSRNYYGACRLIF